MSPRVLVSGASIAGPALAHWLSRYGFDVTVVEKADTVRPGGQAVDLKGPVHRTVLERMGILDRVRAAHVPNADGAIVDARGRRIGTVPGRFAGGEINVPRGDLARIVTDLTVDRCEYLFADTVTALRDTGDHVEVTFAHAGTRTYDLVVGADGLHSQVRALAFGPEADFVRHLGYYYALVGLETGPDDLMYNEPGRMAAVGGPKSPAFLVFASDPLPPARDDVSVQKEQVRRAYAGAGWRVPELMAGLEAADDFYLDAISRAVVDRWSAGRVALVGDAAYGNALGGFGTGLALVGAYVLAGELAVAGGDHRAAFAAYEERMRPYAATGQKVNAGRLLAPATRRGIWLRNRLFSALSLVGPLASLLDRPATGIDLVDYPTMAGRPVTPRR